MPTTILSPEYRDELKGTNYPFGDDATRRSTDGHVFSRATFIDASLYPIGAIAGLYLSRVDVTGDRITVWIGDDSVPLRASAAFDQVNSPIALTFVDSLKRPAGMIVMDPTAMVAFKGWGEGQHTFRREATEFVPSCVIPIPAYGVRGLVAPDGTILSGDVWMVGEDGVAITWDEKDSAIRVDVVGDPLFVRRLCGDKDLFETPRFLKQIDLIGPQGKNLSLTPDKDGNVFITAGDGGVLRTILRITTFGDGVKISVVGNVLAGGTNGTG